jgi:hypothetical protein
VDVPRAKAPSTAAAALAKDGTGVDVAVVVVSTGAARTGAAAGGAAGAAGDGWEFLLQSQLGAARAVIQVGTRPPPGDSRELVQYTCWRTLNSLLSACGDSPRVACVSSVRTTMQPQASKRVSHIPQTSRHPLAQLA